MVLGLNAWQACKNRSVVKKVKNWNEHWGIHSRNTNLILVIKHTCDQFFTIQKLQVSRS